MRFTEGLWRRPEGMTFHGAVEVAEVLEATDSKVEYIVSPKHVRSRGDTLNNPNVTVQITSPMADVLRVRVEHYRGIKPRGPNFDLFPDGAPATPSTQTKRGENTVEFTSGSLTARVDTTANNYSLTFSDARGELTNIGRHGHGIADVPAHLTANAVSSGTWATMSWESASRNEHYYSPFAAPTEGRYRYIMSELNLAIGENIYGLGERFGPFIKNGQGIGMWNSDGGTSSELTYKNVPFYVSSRGYGVFVNHPEEVEFEVGREKCSKVGVSVKGENLEFFIVAGGGIKNAIKNYSVLTGKPPLPPAWTFGLYLSTSFTTSYDQKTVSGFLEGFKERDCPVRVFHFDCFWMKAYSWCDFTWDPDMFPDPKAYLSEIKRKYNVKVCCWINPYIGQRASIFKEGVEKGYFIKRKNGDVYQCDEWQAGMALVDFTNPEASKWYAGLVTSLLDMGVDTVKTDFGERIPHVDVQFHDGSDPAKAHNFYTFLYNKCTFEAVEAKYGKNEAALFARSATSGGQRFPVHWGGDCESTYEAMGETLRGGLSLATCGFGYWSHDIGGFEGTPNEPLFCRWVAFGLFSSHSRLHGSDSVRVPWKYGETAVAVTSKMVRTKHRLMPYLYREAIATHQSGVPMLRSMILEFPEDPVAPFLDRQYMLGNNLLVAPVFHDSRAEYYIPAGKWTCFWTGDVVEGPKFVRKENYPLDLIPVFVRPNSVLLLGPEGIAVPDYEYAKVGLEVRSYQLEDTVEVQVPVGKGPAIAGTVTVAKDGSISASGVEIKK